MERLSTLINCDELPPDFLPVSNIDTQAPERQRRIVIAYDHSDNSDATFAKVIRLGLISPKDEIYIVHIIEQRELQNIFAPIFQHTGMNKPLGNSEVATTAHTITEGLLHEIRKVLMTNGFENVTTEAVLGDPKQSMIDYCQACKPDFLICSPRGLNPVQKMVLGSTSSFLIKNIPCPVLICKLTAQELEERKKYNHVKTQRFEHLIGAIKEKYK
ncbi:uncharacterized protein BX664DRAFT_362652 [Halteromyces radiatus]|uniref:uncharacterized protein n=1 Tax=Halteromyces radiatus TaxID=101107 RepID=UPI0022200C51|nr:uncharacterized protein BX664DRAFT_362652 [Halteromyces radiatus]KAI8077868.1 hypothetical protein BX664DRAFT_362652 [Halteromyces radiatus]